ncbi:SDR family oxidoreductase [Varunaivibrio sulfuroxidans]|uniref:3-oxoacyl-[acyl-carrier protein] reductase n=1 Tax=Varunaivibrio sulfuroxidans TaxID=1773489 RepID=A0A4V2UN14_9PROT|nr:SDR family oxidoreductase [Varunaivibrio sulfuroxidans]TCS60371.1 3-oxoacyl-[acyl-carrier protein] reductase [Varunaivibrio sulfuroxidans]WES30941.1 SDR family oxidoreductase [Varunaivibrio sulfuroxidans]
MDLDIAGKVALVCGASKGLGRAVALALTEEGAEVVINARTEATLAQAARDIAEKTGKTPRIVAADVATEEGRSRILAACPEPDILINNAGGPPPGDFRDWDRDDWIKALDTNMLSAIFLIKATVDGMMARGFGRIVNITSASAKAPIDILGLSNGARGGLTGFIAGLSRKTVGRGVTINNLLPGAFDTERLNANLASAAKTHGKTLEETHGARIASIPAGRFGDPYEYGQLCAYLCSAQAGYITGQNILIDGGAYPGTF